MLNYLALLGWNPGTDREIFRINELIEAFSLENVQKGGSIFDEEKLRWINKNHLEKFVPKEEQYENFKERFLKSPICEKHQWCFSDLYLHSIWMVFKERISVYEDIDILLENREFDYFFDKPEYEATKLLWKDQKKKDASKHLEKLIEKINQMDELSYEHDTIKDAIWDYATEKGRGEVLWPMRYALSGRDRSPDPFVLSSVLGKEETLGRLKNASEALQN